MNPVSMSKKRFFYMSKLSYEDKINLYNDSKLGLNKVCLEREIVWTMG